MDEPIERLEPLVREWTIRAVFPGKPAVEGGHVVFEWMTGKQFLIERWRTPAPQAPDGLAIIGFDEGSGTFLQHYFDSRGVARVYQMTLADGVWRLWRDAPDFSPLDFAQRFTGTFSASGATIVGRWEIARDGAAWTHDFDLIYARVR
ncbi:MAG TPA: hypothetical protein VFX03_10455 [Thermomicrobiales bacterium]|nr:hypothetical protein [Thermomicrobiales bacterium]